MIELSQYQHPLLAPTGRVLSFIEDPDKGVLPASCTMIRLKGKEHHHYRELFYFVQKALVTAAGVSVHLSLFKPAIKATGNLVDFIEKANVILDVQDSMDWDRTEGGNHGIMGSAATLYSLLMDGYDVYMDLSRIRPAGSMGSKGQVASGPEPFMEVFKAVEHFARTQTITSLLSVLSKFNESIRRGGVYKNGAVVTSLPIWHPHFEEYANTYAPKIHPYLFKAAIIPANWEDYLDEIILCLERVNEKDLWLEKAISVHDNVTWLRWEKGHAREKFNPQVHVLPNYTNTLGHNVCKEVMIKSEGTCIIMPLNLGMATEPYQLVEGAIKGMELLCKFQTQDFQSKAVIYLSAKEDRQVGLGLMGLANLLAHQGISYKDFVDVFEAHLDNLKNQGVTLDGNKTLIDLTENGIFSFSTMYPYIDRWVSHLIMAFVEAACVAQVYGMDRAFAIAPTASVAYRYKDHQGYAVCPEYSPPLARKVERLSSSGTSLDGTYEYPPNTEIAQEVSRDIHFRLTVCLQTLMDMTGLGHAISWNVWDSMDFDTWIKFAQSPLKSTYYLWERDQSFLDKSNQVQDTSNSCGVPTR